MTPTTDGPLHVVGQRIPRLEGREKVTGAAVYAADVQLAGLLWGKVLRSPYPYARIRHIDTRRARALPGVHAVITGQDIPPNLVGRRLRDVPVLARDVVRFIGDRVAAVAAEDRDLAEAALALIEVAYEELSPVLDPVEALKPEAPVLHPDLRAYENLQPNFPPGLPNNVHAYLERKRGDVEAGFAAADLIVESTWSSGRVHQAYLEPHACLVHVDQDDRIHVWSSNKGPFTMRAHLADALGVDERRIVVELVRIGGEFGGKGALMNVPIAYHLALASRRPVRMVLTYTEEFGAANPRHGSTIRLKTGLTRDGAIVAHQGTTVFDSGAYGGFKPVPGNVLGGGIKTGGAYRIPNVLLQAFIVYTNNVPGGFFRAPGDPQATFAVESHFDLVAERLGMDPLEFRRRNALREGDVSPAGMQWKDILASAVLEAAIGASRWSEPGERPANVGHGVALINRHVGAGESRTLIRLFEDGQVELVTGAPDAGQGVHTVMQQVAAEVLTIPPERIAIRLGSTDEVPPDPGLGASRHTHIAGQSTSQGAHELAARLKASLAEEMGWPAEAVVLRDGGFHNATERVPFEEAARIAVSANSGPIEILATYVKDHSEQETFIAQVAEVEVDPETGAYKVRRLVTAHDTGTLINPIGAEGQIEGGLVQGFGFSTMEELRIVDGQVTNASFSDYKIPSIADVPPLEMVLIENAVGPGPYNAKSVGEHSLIPTAAAIANAIHDAVGVRITSTPITAEKVYQALKQVGPARPAEAPATASRPAPAG